MENRSKLKDFDKWFARIRQITTYLLGIWVVIYAVTTTGKDLGYILAGFALIGIIPIDRYLESKHGEEDNKNQ